MGCNFGTWTIEWSHRFLICSTFSYNYCRFKKSFSLNAFSAKLTFASKCAERTVRGAGDELFTLWILYGGHVKIRLFHWGCVLQGANARNCDLLLGQIGRQNRGYVIPYRLMLNIIWLVVEKLGPISIQWKAVLWIYSLDVYNVCECVSEVITQRTMGPPHRASSRAYFYHQIWLGSGDGKDTFYVDFSNLMKGI